MAHYGVDTMPAPLWPRRTAVKSSAHRSATWENYAAFFDVLTLSHVIEHVHDPLIRSGMPRVLKPGGYVWIETPNIESAAMSSWASWRGLERRGTWCCSTRHRCESARARRFEKIRILPPRDVTERLFTLSAAMRAGRLLRPIGLTVEAVAAQMRHEATRAREMVGATPTVGFVGAVPTHAPVAIVLVNWNSCRTRSSVSTPCWTGVRLSRFLVDTTQRRVARHMREWCAAPEAGWLAHA